MNLPEKSPENERAFNLIGVGIWMRFYRSEFETEAFQHFWKQQGEGFSPAFVAYLETVLLETAQ